MQEEALMRTNLPKNMKIITNEIIMITSQKGYLRGPNSLTVMKRSVER